jgi:phospholipid/cholesterol/gamma-HCH transport system ATP-binding protein
MSAEPLIELVGVEVVHEEAPEQVLVQAVDWQIGPGECWVVAGDSASGKTSLLATAAGWNRPATGTLRIFGRELGEVSEAEQVGWRRRIGFVFEHGGRLLSHLTVSQNVALPLAYHTELEPEAIRARVRELLAQVEMETYAGVLPSRLSPRLQQRVALARALAMSREVLFLDNPLGGLSQSGMRWWSGFLRETRARQQAQGRPLTVVASAEDFRGWQELADHFAMIHERGFRVLGGRDQLAGSGDAVVREFLTSVD